MKGGIQFCGVARRLLQPDQILPLCHPIRFDLVVGHKNGRRAHRLLELLELATGTRSQFSIEIR
jgi:hypothetical protein